MAADYSGRRNSSAQLLEELEVLSQSLYQSHTSTNRRTASFALPRTSVPPISAADETGIDKDDKKLNPKSRSMRMSLSPWHSRPKFYDDNNNERWDWAKVPNQKESNNKWEEKAGKKGLWNWKPIRALSHIGMQKLSCLFSVQVVTVQGLPASMNGLRLSVCVRKKETRDGSVHTMPSRVSQGTADFEETLFIKCHVYCSPGSRTTQLKFEARPFLIYVFAPDAKELEFGRTSVDLSVLIQESIEKNLEGTRIRQWDTSFNLSGKAKGGQLVLQLGFQIMEKDGGGIGIYSQAEGQKSSRKFSLSTARTQSKSSFSVPSARMSSRAEAWTPSQLRRTEDFRGIDDLNLDEPAAPVPSSSFSVQKMEDLYLPEFEVVDKGVEIQDRDVAEEGQSDENSDKSEVVKEIVHDQVHLTQLTEDGSISKQTKSLESVTIEEPDEETKSQRLDADEETVTMKYLQILEGENTKELTLNQLDIPSLKLEGTPNSRDMESKVLVPDLGKGLGCLIQTKDGGYLAAMNPLDTAVDGKDTPRLAMQISKPLVLPFSKPANGFELFQRMASTGLEELGSEISSVMPVDELIGKSAGQIAFEGIASAIIHGRNREGASSSAARTIAAVKTIATAMRNGRKQRIRTGIGNVSENPLTVNEILAFSMQKIEAIAVEALKIQAEMAEEDAPSDVSPLNVNSITGNEKDENHPLASAVPLHDWVKYSTETTSEPEAEDTTSIIISVVVQLRDPQRQYEAVGGPMIALTQAMGIGNNFDNHDEEKRFKVESLHVGGLKVRTKREKNVWDTEKHRLTAAQWLVEYGLGKAGKKSKQVLFKGQDLLWSISLQEIAATSLKPMRNPDVKFSK